MNEVDELIRIYKAMNQDGREQLRSVARHLQKRFPSEQRASLTLVKNVNNVKFLDGVVDSRVDCRSLSGMSEAVHSK